MSKGLQHYEYLFSRCTDNHTILFDATPKYMLYPENVRRVYEQHHTSDSLKIMFILREPVKREISWYSHLLRESRSRRPATWSKEVLNSTTGEELSFHQYMEAVILPSIHSDTPTNRGLYAYWLRQWFQVFDRSQMFITSYDDLRRNETDFLLRLHSFLDLPLSLPARKTPQSNAKHVTRDPIPCATETRLAQLYASFNEDLYSLLEQHPGPPMEQDHFRPFLFECQDEETEDMT